MVTLKTVRRWRRPRRRVLHDLAVAAEDGPTEPTVVVVVDPAVVGGNGACGLAVTQVISNLPIKLSLDVHQSKVVVLWYRGQIGKFLLKLRRQTIWKFVCVSAVIPSIGIFSTLGQAPGFTHKHQARFERLARDKHSRLLWKVVTYGRKKFYSIGHR